MFDLTGRIAFLSYNDSEITKNIVHNAGREN